MMKKRLSAILAMLLIFAVIALAAYFCNYFYPHEIINHDRPNLEVDFSPFTLAGCSSSDPYSCDENSEIYTLGCDDVEYEPLLGGLTPHYPVLKCIKMYDLFWSLDELSSECFYHIGVMAPYCYRSVVYVDSKYRLVETVDEFRDLFVPIDTPEEALSFVLATGNYQALYDLKKDKRLVYLARVLEDTHVDAVSDGYLVHIFYYTFMGCGSHETVANTVKVTFDGTTEVLNGILVFRNPDEYGLCRD